MLSRNVTRGIATTAAASAVVALAAGWAVAGSDDDSGTEIRAALVGAEPTVAARELAPAIVENFALFRERAAAKMPDDVARQVGSPTRYGRNVSLARAIETVTGTGWVIPGDGYLCLAVPDPVDGYGTTCAPTEVAVRQGLALTLSGNLPDGKAAETLVVADGVRALRDTDGRSRSVDPSLGVVSVLNDDAGQLRVER